MEKSEALAKEEEMAAAEQEEEEVEEGTAEGQDIEEVEVEEF